MFMFGRGAVLPANAAGSDKSALGIEGIVEGGHAAPLCHTEPLRKSLPAAIGKLNRCLAAFHAARQRYACTFYAALPVNRAAVGRPSSIGSDGSRDHSFQEPKYIRTSFTPAFFNARKVFDARAPLKQ